MMNDLTFSIDLAKTMVNDREREAQSYMLLRKVQTRQPQEANPLGRHIGRFVLALALALRLR
jgi:hypothetical protein